MSELINRDRRLLLGRSAMGIAATGVLLTGCASGAGGPRPAASFADPTRGPHTTFGPLKHIDAGDLNIAYADVGAPERPAVILLHGWPYDIHCYVDVAPLLVDAGVLSD